MVILYIFMYSYKAATFFTAHHYIAPANFLVIWHINNATFKEKNYFFGIHDRLIVGWLHSPMKWSMFQNAQHFRNVTCRFFKYKVLRY